MSEPTKIEVTIRVTEKDGYNVREIATAKIEDAMPWEKVKRGVSAITEDAIDRVARQLAAENTIRVEKAQEVESFS